MSALSPTRPTTASRGYLHLRLFGEPFASIARKLVESRRLRRLPRVMADSYGDPDFDLARAARLLHFSENHFNTLLIRRCGWSFHRLLTRFRLLKACRRLEETDAPIKEVAFEAGFGSLRTFLRQFERVLGETPSRYRERHRPC